MKILDDAQKGARAADDILAIPLREASRRLGVKGIGGIWLIIDDCKPVDSDPLRHRLATCVGDSPAGIVGAVDESVDDAPAGVRLRRGKTLHGEVDGAADRGPPDKRA